MQIPFQAPRRLLSCCLALALSACSAIPFSSYSKLKQLEAENFVQLDPAEMFVHVEIPSGFELDESDFSLGITINSGASHTLSMEPTTLTQLGLEQTPKAWDATRQEYLFKLDTDGTHNMRVLQQEMLQQKVDDVRVDINFEPLSWPPQSDSMSLSVDLHLTSSQGFFRFLDEAKIPAEFLREMFEDAARKRAEAD